MLPQFNLRVCVCGVTASVGWAGPETPGILSGGEIKVYSYFARLDLFSLGLRVSGNCRNFDSGLTSSHNN